MKSDFRIYRCNTCGFITLIGKNYIHKMVCCGAPMVVLRQKALNKFQKESLSHIALAKDA